MQEGLRQMMLESYGINLCFSTSSAPSLMDSSIELRTGDVIPHLPSENLSANSQAIRDAAGVAEGIGINGKLVQKPKRKKHRPKVIKEGQSAKLQKSKPNPPKEKGNQPTGKRKYIRRKGRNAPTKQPPSEGADTQTRAERGATQRCLNYDGEDQHGNADLVSQTQVTEIPIGPGDTQSSISGVERSNVQVPCHWGGTSSSISSVDPMADLQELRVDSMPKRVTFDLNNSIVNMTPNNCSNLMESSGQFFQFGSREEVQANQLLDFHAGMPVSSVSHLNSLVNHMQHRSINFDQYICSSQSCTEKLPRHDQMLHGYRMPENLTAPSQHTERVSMGGNFNPEAFIREGAIINQMAQCYRLPESPLVPLKHSERDAMNGDLNEFSVKNDYLKFATNDNYQTGAAFGFHDSPGFSDVLAIGKKREHNAINGHQISFNIDFDNSNRAMQFCSDVPLSTSSPTSYFSETCKRMRSENHSNWLNGATVKFSSSSTFSDSWNTNKVSAINPGICSLADIQRSMVLEKSRASQQMIDIGMSGNNMVQEHIKPSLQNIVDKDFIALPDKQFRSFTAQNIQFPGNTVNPLGESNIPRNGIHQTQSWEIRPSQHHSSDNFALPDKLSSGTVNPSIENYIQSNAIHQLQSLENVVTKVPVLLSETHNTSTQDDAVNNYCIAAITDAQIRTTSDEVVGSLFQPTSQSTRNGNSHLNASRLTAEEKCTEKPKKRGRPRKETIPNGKPKDRDTKGKENVGRAKHKLPKGASTDFLKTEGITYASEPSTEITPRLATVESKRCVDISLDILKTSDHDKYRSKETHGGSISQATAPSVDLLDGIIQKIKLLSINRPEEIAAEVPKNALVPYEGKFGALVAFEGKVKKSRLRAKVNIDPVTTLMWNLLMGPDMGDGAEGLDKDKEKWLDEERRVFRGRVDSFIARMHLVQGDRRFSPWKGSVVDSVVGVFLTQNVSDHLSSSAFMAVAAKFPAKSEVPEIPVAEMSYTPPKQKDSCSGLFGDSIKLQGKLFIEEISDIRSLVTTEDNEESNSNELIGSSSGYGANHAAGGCPVSYRKSLTGSHENGPPGSVFATVGFSSVEAEDGSLEDVISSQNSAVSSQNSPDYLFHRTDPIVSSSLQTFTEEDYIMRNMSNGIGSSTEYTELPIQDPKGMPDGNARSSEYHGLNLLPVSGVNKGVLLDLNRSYQPLHTSISYVQNGESDFTGASCFSHMDKSFCTGPDRVNLSSVTQSESSLYQLLPASAMGNKNKTRITDSSSQFLYSINGSLSQERSTFPSEPSQQGDFSPVVKQNFQPLISSEKVPFSKDHSFCENHFPRNKTEAPFVVQRGYSNLQEVYTTTTEQMGGEQFQSGCSQQDNDVRVQTTAYEKNCTSNLCENQNSHSEVLQGVASNSIQKFSDTQEGPLEVPKDGSKAKKVRGRPKKKAYDWDSLRKEMHSNGGDKQRCHNARDTVDWEAVRQAEVRELSETIRERGMNNMLAERIKEFLNRLVTDHGSIDLEWLRDVQPDKAKDYLLSIRGLGLKSVECVRLLTLHHMAFPVDTNVGRICVRLGWVPLQPLPESLQLHLLEMYPMLEHIQKYLWPRLCKLDQRTLYELHYQMITFGKVFCTKSKPNCNSCPMRAECKHFASAFASARLALPAPEEKSLATSEDPKVGELCHQTYIDSKIVGQLEWNTNYPKHVVSGNHQPIVEEPPSPEPEPESAETKEGAIEDFFCEDPDEIPTINLNIEEFTQNLKSYMQANNIEIEDADMSKALVAITPEAASIPTPKLKNVSRLRTEHQVYELPDSHPLLEGFDQREPDDPCPYLLSIWTPGETAQSTDVPKTFCNSEETGKLCGSSTCFSCNSIREMQAQKVRGTLLIPCRTAMRGSFPLNGTYFQVNEVFADHYSSQNPIDVPRSWIWNLPRRTVYFGTSIPTIFRGLTTEEIQQCFWRGFVCVRGFDRALRAPRPLYARLHFPASKVARGKKPGAARVKE
ncbi:protein ROS1A-like [Phragmites australis]|uniref:protein ROS1A-like n=1 Tax=Phragmites australis TaxID=29695 RepID=UPI002D782E2F|nr:protein ROS1A-like [Phragmites australis]XP_062223301.1 protein ROS1A-like [Phragmites australis]XP_062223302.1 protein ROS1A-like [Phragmites australis]XP_062223303.1 protein ROS1A-like [Phragmites australis]XP_062223304.1 protein ROS1A-like [Phragmites australis]